MLVLSRKVGEAIQVGDIVIRIVQLRGGKVSVGITADRAVPVRRIDGGKVDSDRQSK